MLGISEIWAIFEWIHGRISGNRDEDRRRVEEWLDAVHADLRLLSDLWIQLSTGDLTPGQIRDGLALRGQRTKAIQVATYTRLEEFYRATSRIIPADNPFQERFLNQLASILIARNRARRALDTASASPASDPTPAIQEMQTAVRELQRQLAVLEVAITTFKAQAGV